MSPELLMSLTAGRGLSFDHIAGGGRPEWTPEDAALACQGLDDCAYSAFAYRWAHDDSLKSRLYGCLENAAERLAYHEKWPDRTRHGQRYRSKLVQTAIWEERFPIATSVALLVSRDPRAAAKFVRGRTAQEMRAEILAAKAGFDLLTWDRELDRRYEGIRGLLDQWCKQAHVHIHYLIRDDEAA